MNAETLKRAKELEADIIGHKKQMDWIGSLRDDFIGQPDKVINILGYNYKDDSISQILTDLIKYHENFWKEATKELSAL